MPRIRLFSLVLAVGAIFSVVLLSLIEKNEYQLIHEAQVALSGRQSATNVYPEELDLRIIVLTFNRSESLRKLLKSVDKLEIDGDKASLEIWIDRDVGKDGDTIVHPPTLRVARAFAWSRGQTRVHVHSKHVGLYGQWIDTWRPAPGSSELALFLEDDISVSPYAYRWLKAVHKKYGHRTDIAGYTLQSESVNSARSMRPISRPRNQTVFLYKLLGSWGYAPHPKSWMHFQDWYHAARNDPHFHPYVPKATTFTNWYKTFEQENRQDSMWTIWHVYYCDKFDMFTVYNNIEMCTNDSNHLLCANRMEVGLHVGRKGPENTKNILRIWSDDYIKLPDNPLRYEFDGTARQSENR